MFEITLEEITRRFTYVRPNEQRRVAHENVGQVVMEAAENLLKLCPNPSRELSLALTHLEQVRMYANAAIATNSMEPQNSQPPADSFHTTEAEDEQGTKVGGTD